jgi:hypothetical protein
MDQSSSSSKRPRPPSCPVCYEIPFDPKSGICGHTMCGPCEKRLKKKSEGKKCPMCNRHSEFVPNRMLEEVLLSNYPEEMEEMRSKHTTEGWIAVRKRTDPSIELLESSFPTDITLRLLRRIERLLWSKANLTYDDLYLFSEISKDLWLTVTSTDSIVCLPEGRCLQLVKGDRLYSVYMFIPHGHHMVFHASWMEDLE